MWNSIIGFVAAASAASICAAAYLVQGSHHDTLAWLRQAATSGERGAVPSRGASALVFEPSFSERGSARQ